MSELTIQNKQTNIRLGLLATTSAIALAACVASVPEAVAADRPTVWIEGGWHLDSVTGSNDLLVPPLDQLTTVGYPTVPTSPKFYGQGSGGFPSFTDMEKSLGRSGGAEGSVSFQPNGSDWVFGISARYGRTHSRRRLDERQDITGEPGHRFNQQFGSYAFTPHYTNYVIQANDNTEAHTILDFQVGKDVGLGLFGSRTEAVISFGARYAQMNMTSKGHSYAQPAVRFYGHGGINGIGKYSYNIFGYHEKSTTLLQRYSNFQGIGPSFSWNNTTGLLGDLADGQLALDWGANAAVLFGRQKVKVNHNSQVLMFNTVINVGGAYKTESGSGHRTQSRRVTAPNLGGFAALSYRFTNAKLSMGYRADFFFGAMDRGLDTSHSVTTGYHGPFATISIGLGG